MIDSETVVGTGLRITVAKDELADQARARRARCLDAHGRARARRDPAARRGRPARISPRPTWSSRCARRVDAEVDGEGDGRRAGPAAARHRALAARTARSTIEHRPDEAVRRRSRPARRATACTRTRPRTSRGCPTSTTCALHTVDRDALRRDDRARRPQRVARREPPGADRHPRALRAGQARDGRDRLVPARGQGDRRRRRRCPSSRRSSRRARCRSSRASRPAPTSSSSACTRTTSSSAPTARG